MTTNHFHQPVLLDATLNGLAIQSDGIYIDGTFGRGGHSLGILKQLGPNGRLMAMDKDPQAILASKKPEFQDSRFSIEHASFSELENLVKKRNWTKKVNGIVLDLGVSSPQLDNPLRGFSFSKNGPLDMRMDTQQPLDASTWINTASFEQIYQVIRDYGEERFAKRIAKAIVKAREIKSITETSQLSNIVKQAFPIPSLKKHPATRTFQAIRIFINRELEDLEQCLPQCYKVMHEHGRLCVISFHSLEDRIVKRFIQKESKGDAYPPDLPIRASAIQPRLKKINALIKPSIEEINSNPRARSARLRIAEIMR